MLSWFKPTQIKTIQKPTSDDNEIFLLKMKIAELEKSLIQLGEIIQKTNETLLLMQENMANTTKASKASLNLAQQHEDIFKKIMEDKLLVFGLTKTTKVVKPGDPEPKSD